jgi:hypothetical protein
MVNFQVVISITIGHGNLYFIIKNGITIERAIFSYRQKISNTSGQSSQMTRALVMDFNKSRLSIVTRGFFIGNGIRAISWFIQDSFVGIIRLLIV